MAKEYQTEHGWSLYIETGKHKLLFDMGASGLFLENAKKLNVDIADIDWAVVSHGHYDHGGGLKMFLHENKKAEVFVHQKAFEKHYARRSDGRLAYIGLDEELKYNPRLVLTGERFFIAKGIETFANVRSREFYAASNRALLAEEEDGQIAEDTFAHEQNLVIKEEDKTVLFTGCAHSGIVNIVQCFMDMKRGPADYVFGGFHLYNPSSKQNEEPELVAQIGQYLKDTPSTYFTGHCTGSEPYHLLKGMMGEQLQYLAAGGIVHI